LPQDPQLVFVKKTVREDLLEILDYKKLPREEKMARLAAEAALCGLEDLAARRGLTAAGEGKSGGGSGDGNGAGADAERGGGAQAGQIGRACDEKGAVGAAAGVGAGSGAGAGARTAAVPAIELREVWFKYEKDLPDVVKGLSCKVFPGELLAILGGNGTGKTTALSLMARLNRPYRGKVLIDGRPIESRPDLFDGCLGVLPQDPQLVFVKKTVREDLLEILDYKKLSREEKMARLAAEAALCGLEDLLDAHPYDLSGGEQQRAALAKILLTRPRILLLDEPTKGLDAEFKQVFAGILKRLAAAGAAIVLVSHDVEFCAEHADRCGLFFDGDIVSEGRPADFFPGNNFYTTAANRIARSVFPRAVTVGDVLDALGGAEPGQSEAELERSGAEPEQSGAVLEQSGAVPERSGAVPERSGAVLEQSGAVPERRGAEPEQSGAEPERRGAEPERRGAEPELPPGLVTAATPAPGRGGAQPPSPEPAPSPPPGLAPWRKALAGGAAAALALTVIFAAPRVEGLKAFISGGDIAIAAAGDLKNVWTYAGIMLALALEAIGLTLALTWKRAGPPPGPPLAMAQATPTAGLAKRRLPKRTLAAAVMILLAIPLTIYIGYAFLGDRKYYFISLLIILETMLPFALVFESRKPQARELVVIAVLFGIAAAGRAAFFMLPSFKPVIAMVIISGVAFGGEAGFLVGAVTGFVSNIFFGQGPWTPWQMFAFGIIGFLAGVLFRKGLLGRGRLSLSVFGALAAVVIYGGIMNPAMLLIYQAHLNWAMFFAVYLQGLPFDLVHGIATVLFLQIGSQVMLEKLDRIKMKYGLVE
jgi:energy-coupling factor transporter ATP-binding protein EcfA2/uncharacterized membrane protein